MLLVIDTLKIGQEYFQPNLILHRLMQIYIIALVNWSLYRVFNIPNLRGSVYYQYKIMFLSTIYLNSVKGCPNDT